MGLFGIDFLCQPEKRAEAESAVLDIVDRYRGQAAAGSEVTRYAPYASKMTVLLITVLISASKPLIICEAAWIGFGTNSVLLVMT